MPADGRSATRRGELGQRSKPVRDLNLWLRIDNQRVGRIQVASVQQTQQMILLAAVLFTRRRIRSVRPCAWPSSLAPHGLTSFTPMKQSENKRNAAGPSACMRQALEHALDPTLVQFVEALAIADARRDHLAVRLSASTPNLDVVEAIGCNGEVRE